MDDKKDKRMKEFQNKKMEIITWQKRFVSTVKLKSLDWYLFQGTKHINGAERTERDP